jgi:hypothetical protein
MAPCNAPSVMACMGSRRCGRRRLPDDNQLLDHRQPREHLVAWLRNRPIEVLVEPTAFLDAESAERVRAILFERSRKRLVLISIHDLCSSSHTIPPQLPKLIHWEARHDSSPIAPDDHQRELNSLRYIQANPKAAGVREGFYDPYSNYEHYSRLETDGIRDWHPAFLQLAPTAHWVLQAL